MKLPNKIIETIETAVENQKIIGITLGITNKDKILVDESRGVISVENKLPFDKQTLISPHSIAKVFCLLVILRLVDRKLLDLDTPVVEYLEDFHFSDQIGEEITLRHLLSHSSGLPQSGKYWGPKDEEALQRYMYDELVNHKFISYPGEIHEYSNTAFCLAGYIAEKVSGKYYDDIVQNEVFDPLDMLGTFDPTVAMTYSLSLHHLKKQNRLKVMHRMTRNNSGHPSSFAYCNIRGILHIAQMFLGNGLFRGARYLSESQVNEVFTPQISRKAEYHNHPWAKLYEGFTVGLNYGVYNGKPCFRHGGVGLGSDTRLDIFPDEGFAFVSFVNYYEGNVLNDIVMDTYDFLLNSDKNLRYTTQFSQDREEMIFNEKIIGKYHHKSSGNTIEIEQVNNTYKLKMGNNSVQLFAKSLNEFYYIMEFKPENLTIPVVYFQGKIGNYILVSGIPYQWVQTSSSQIDLKSYCGTYIDPNNYNPDEKIAIRWNEEDKAFEIKELGDSQYSTIITISKFEFTCKLGTLEFFNENSKKYFQLGYSVYYYLETTS